MAYTVDFQDSVEQARQQINAWAQRHTEGRIENLLLKGEVHSAVVLAIVNAVFFKGSWASKFDTSSTKEGRFCMADGDSVTVLYMSRNGAYRYALDDHAQVIELPYQGGRLAMLAILPRFGMDLATVEASLSEAQVNEWRNKLREKNISLFLPKFRCELQLDMVETLTRMGMESPFRPWANFTGMSPRGKKLHIDLLAHKAVLEVSEEGTVAAAATAATIRWERKPRPPVVFRANRPFLFLVMDQETGALLFMGRYARPT